MTKTLITTFLLLLLPAAFAADISPYRGQQYRNIKALSDGDIDAYLKGKGMGFAKAAELNHYPGPRHVLDLAEKLKLSKDQRQKTQKLFENMQANAVQLGRLIVAKEKELDVLFAGGKPDEEKLRTTLLEIGSLTARLRHVHLSAHLKQKNILSAKQVRHYDHLRGYGTPGNQHHGHDH